MSIFFDNQRVTRKFEIFVFITNAHRSIDVAVSPFAILCFSGISFYVLTVFLVCVFAVEYSDFSSNPELNSILDEVFFVFFLAKGLENTKISAILELNSILAEVFEVLYVY